MEHVDDASIAALEELYRRRYRRFLRLALAVTGSRDAAADAVQEGFARAIRHRQEFRGEGPLEAADEAAANGHVAPSAEVRAAVAALPERQRHALFLRHYADLDYDQIGQVLGIARGTVAATLHAAHASVRRSVEGIAR
jgi:DNA-directed RNA polymerase specialized sigma24 family protein